MSRDTFDIAGLAAYLRRDARELAKLADKGLLPGRRVGGQWRFHRAEVQQWLEGELAGYTDEQLENVEEGMRAATDDDEPDRIVGPMMSVETTAVPLDGRTAPGVLQALVEAANGGWQVYEPDKVLQAVRDREELHTTALPEGVAIPHPRRPMADELGDSLIAYGRTLSGIPFGGPRGQLTDLFFLVLCRDDRTHLQVLARLSRMIQREDFRARLREADTAAESLAVITETEGEILAGS